MSFDECPHGTRRAYTYSFVIDNHARFIYKKYFKLQATLFVKSNLRHNSLLPCVIIPIWFLLKYSVYIKHDKMLYYRFLFVRIPSLSSYILFIFRASSMEWVTTTKAVPISLFSSSKRSIRFNAL